MPCRKGHGSKVRENVDDNLADRVYDACQNDRPDDVKGPCAICGKEVNASYFCFGCGHFICEKERSETIPGIRHSFSAHKWGSGKFSKN
jgi:hypothetical protein